MKILVGLAGGLLVVLMLVEFFVTFLLPRRVKRDPKLARGVLRFGWNGWRLASRRLPPASADTMLGLYGPLGLIGMLVLWTLGLVVGFAALQWARQAPISRRADRSDSATISSSALVASSAPRPTSRRRTPFGARAVPARGGLRLRRALHRHRLPACALPGLLAEGDRRLPARPARGITSDRGGAPRALGRARGLGEPRRLPRRVGHVVGRVDGDASLLPDSGLLSLTAPEPELALGSKTTVLDTSAFTIVAAPNPGAAKAAEATFAIGRHALADLAYMFRAKPFRLDPPRLDDAVFTELWELASRSGLDLRDDETEAHARLQGLVGKYEPYAAALARWLELGLPDWLPSHEAGRRTGAAPAGSADACTFCHRTSLTSRGRSRPCTPSCWQEDETGKEASLGAEQDRDEQGFAEDLELTEAEARSVKGGVLPIEGGDAGSSSSGFS